MGFRAEWLQNLKDIFKYLVEIPVDASLVKIVNDIWMFWIVLVSFIPNFEQVVFPTFSQHPCIMPHSDEVHPSFITCFHHYIPTEMTQAPRSSITLVFLF